MFNIKSINIDINEKKVESFVGVDIGTYAIKVLQIRKELDKLYLDTYGQLEMAAYDSLSPGSITNLGEQKIIKALQDLFLAAKITSKNVIFGIPISSTFISTINIPKVSDKELKTLIPFEAKKYLPIPISEVEINYWRTEANSSEQDTIIIAAVKSETMQMYKRFAKALSIENVFFEIESLAGSRASASGMPKDEALLFIDIGGNVTGISFIHNSIVKNTDIIQIGSYEVSLHISKILGLGIDVAEKAKRLFGFYGDESSPYLAESIGLASYPLFEEVIHILLKYERMYNININKVILAGGGSLVKGIKEYASEILKKEVILADPFKNLILPDNFKKVSETFDQEYATATGLALKNI